MVALPLSLSVGRSPARAACWRARATPRRARRPLAPACDVCAFASSRTPPHALPAAKPLATPTPHHDPLGRRPARAPPQGKLGRRRGRTRRRRRRLGGTDPVARPAPSRPTRTHTPHLSLNPPHQTTRSTTRARTRARAWASSFAAARPRSTSTTTRPTGEESERGERARARARARERQQRDRTNQRRWSARLTRHHHTKTNTLRSYYELKRVNTSDALIAKDQ